MALLTKRRRAARFHQAPTSKETAAPRPARRRRWRLLALILVPAALLWFLPAIVAHTPLLGWILAKATAELNGTVAVESASLGWLSPITVHGIEIRDAQGKPVLKAHRLQGNKSLAATLLDFSKLGHLRLEQPKLDVRLRHDGSNVEDLLVNYLNSDEESNWVGVSLEIVDGQISVTDQSSRRSWQIEDLRLSLSTPADADGEMKLEASASMPDPRHPGRFAVGFAIRGRHTAQGPAATAGALTIESDAVPLEMFESLVGRFAPQTELSGRLRCKIHTQWDGASAADKTVVQAELTCENLALSAPWLGTDRVQLEHLRAFCQVARQQDRLEIKQSSVDCDLGGVSLNGTLELGDQEPGPLLASALRQSCEIYGRIELARLAQMLPGTLRVRKGTRITSGQVAFEFSSSRGSQGPDPQVMVWRGRVEASDLKAEYGGRQLAWEKPILLELTAHDSPQGPVVESLKCESDFLKLHAAGTPDELAASASFNLEELADQLGQFVDLGGIGFGGDGWAQLNWTRSQQKFEADARLELRNFQLAMPQQKRFSEENLLISLSAGGRTGLGAGTQIETAWLEVKTPTDNLRVQLAGPVDDFSSGGTWPVDLQAEGQLDNWPPRLRTWITVGDWNLAGAFQLSARATASTGGLIVDRARLTVEQLQLLSPSLKIKEPAVELTASGNWDLQRRRLQIKPVTLNSNSLSIQAGSLLLEMPENDPLKITAAAKYRGNLARLHQWFADEKARPKWRLAGQLSGTAEFSQSAGKTGGRLDVEVGNLAVTFPSGKRFNEPSIHLAARGSYEHQDKMLQLEQMDIACGTLSARTGGRITQGNDQTELRLDGQIDYDWKKLCALLRPYIGSGVQIVGRGTGPASYHGPLDLARAKAGASLRWERVDAYGFQVGPGELKASLADGVVQAAPMNLAVNGGRLLLEPRLRLAPEPMELTLPPGPLAEQVKITPAMCASALKFIAPVLADVSTAQGRFSIELEGCRIPLDDLAKADLAGRFTIHSVQVGPGPLIRELAILTGRAAPAKLRRESVVPFRMVNGRVYHQGLELIFPELTIRTRGSVGLDQTLAVMAEMPIPPKWLGNNLAGSALRNQTIRLPIGGTLSKPKIDRRELDRVSRRFLEKAAQNVIEDELGKQLDRLFGPPR